MENKSSAEIFPGWAKAFAIIIAGLGLFDFFFPELTVLKTPGFFLVITGIAVTIARLDKISRSGISWLAWAFLAWGLLDFLSVFFVFIASGMTRSFLTSIAFRSPSWVIFGVWLFYAANLAGKSSPQTSSHENYLSNAKAVFRFAAILLGVFVFFSEFNIVSIQLSENQTLTVAPLTAEFMTTTESGAGFGKIGFFSMIQQVADEETGKISKLPWLGFWWFPAQLLLLPLAWFFAGRHDWKKLALLFAVGLIALLSIPLQLSLQYGFKPFGSKGFLEAGYYLMFVPLLIQLWGFKIARSASTLASGQSRPVDQPTIAAFPRQATWLAFAIALIWTLSLPVLQRSAIDSMIHASRNNRPDKFPALLESLKRQVRQNPVEVALCKALDEKETRLVAWLLTLKPDLNIKPARNIEPPLWWAMRGSGSLELTKMLLEAGADPNKDLYEGSSYSSATPLGFAIDLHLNTQGREYLKLLARYGADLNRPVNNKGTYPIEMALAHSNHRNLTGFIEEFVALGGDPTLKGSGNLFFLALLNRDEIVVDFVKSIGVSSTSTDNKGNTFLHLMVERTSFDYGFNLGRKEEKYLPEVINVKNAEGLTPLHLAVEKNHAGMVETLIKHGADANLKSEAGVSPLELARSKNYKRLVAIMESAGSGR